MNYSSLSRRFLAYCIDVLVLIALYIAIGFLLIFPPVQDLPMIGFWLYLGLILANWLYFALFESSARQATIGQKVMKIKIVDVRGERISFMRATARCFMLFLSRLFLFIGFLPLFFTKKRQAFHDKLTSTLFIQE